MIRYYFYLFLLLCAGVAVETSGKPDKANAFILILFAFIYLMIICRGGNDEWV